MRLRVTLAVWLAVAMHGAIAGTPDEDFRSGLSAFNRGDFVNRVEVGMQKTDRDRRRA